MVTITLKIPISCNKDTNKVLENTVAAYTQSFNRVAAKGWDLNRINSVELHKLTYKEERTFSPLPSQLVCSARNKATEALRSAKTKIKKKKKASKPKSKSCSVRYDARSATIKLAQGKATLATIEGRKEVSLKIPDFQRDRIAWKVCSSDLCQDKRGNFFLHVVVEKEEKTFEPSGKVVGVDLGVNRPAVTSEAKFFGEKRWKEIEARNFRLKRALQAKGTKSAKRRLKTLSGKVNRFRKDCDHVLSKRLVTSVKEGTTLALEDLTNIRERVKARKRERRRIHSWSFSRLQMFLDYKSKLYGVRVIYVDPRYTSQECSKCSYVKKSNRSSQSWFKCRRCGFEHNADLNASKNLATRGKSAYSGPQSIGLSQPLNRRLGEQQAPCFSAV